MAQSRFNDLSSPLALLETRRSGKPRDLIAPGPSSEQLRRILSIAARTPDHGKLFPWRFVTVGADQREALAELLTRALATEKPDASPKDIDAAREFAHQAPSLVVVLSRVIGNSPIPVFEQELSAGAATMNLLHAVHASGFAAGWLSGWMATSPMVRNAFGQDGDRIVGFVFIGTPARELSERPRPELDNIVGAWKGRHT